MCMNICVCIYASMEDFVNKPENACANQFGSLQTITYGFAKVAMWHTSFRKIYCFTRMIVSSQKFYFLNLQRFCSWLFEERKYSSKHTCVKF